MNKLNNISALVVSYFPDHEVIIKLLKSLSSQVDQLILIDNGGGREVAEAIRLEGVALEYIELGKNFGLGYALNIGFERSIRMGAKYVATFDQDSAPSIDLINSLWKTHQNFETQGVNCAAVGPVFFDRRDVEKIYFPFYFEKSGKINSAIRNEWGDDFVETDALITSGMLVRADVWADGIQYDEGLFVDYTDTEWCFRARAKGYKLIGSFQVEMGHAPSDAPPARVLGLSFFRYSPLRRFYYFRNTVIFCRAPYVSRAWSRRLSLALALRFFVNLFIDEKKLHSFRMMVKGVLDGFRGKSGEFRV